MKNSIFCSEKRFCFYWIFLLLSLQDFKPGYDGKSSKYNGKYNGKHSKYNGKYNGISLSDLR